MSTRALARREPAAPALTRRRLLKLSFWAGLIASAAGSLGTGLDIVYPRKVQGFGGPVPAGHVSLYPPGSKARVMEARTWLVHLTEEQGGPGLLALWWKCPHLGCTVPWRPEFEFEDPRTRRTTRGWFRCPCHGSTYDHAGVRVYGPAPRPLDTFGLSIDANGNLTIDTGAITPGGDDNPQRALRL